MAEDPKFTVDTHLFRELGELLVGRDSTALIELVKNAYDADARTVSIYGESLESAGAGYIQVTDDGTGMPLSLFKEGFLRIASRVKELGDRRSLKFGRRYTGAKGVGRLAAHKLARHLTIESIPDRSFYPGGIGVRAEIDWDAVEKFETLEELNRTETKAVTVSAADAGKRANSGTTITLNRLRRRWTPTERGRFVSEVQTFSPPEMLIDFPRNYVTGDLLFEKPTVKDESTKEATFSPVLLGDFATGEEYWQVLAQTSDWLIEIDALSSKKRVFYNILPTKNVTQEFPNAIATKAQIPHPDSDNGPFFQARILVREGVQKGSRDIRSWASNAFGVRVFMEGFRVLPYGDRSDDWLSLDRDYASRPRTSAWLKSTPLADDAQDEDAFLVHLPNRSYFGAVFLTQERAPTLRMLVNREGFVPTAAFDHTVSIVRVGIDLCTRRRAATRFQERQDRSQSRALNAAQELTRKQSTVTDSLSRAKAIAGEAKARVSRGDVAAASETVTLLESELDRLSRRLSVEGSMLRVLSSVGTQMAAFVHEINGLLSMAESVESALERIRTSTRDSAVRRELAEVSKRVSDLRRSLERQAAYLLDIVTPDARRRRSRLTIAERFDVARQLVDGSAQRRSITIENQIPADVRTPPMFSAELVAVFANLLTNAVKAVEEGGHIKATGETDAKGRVIIRIENSGAIVDLTDAERWFKPFESTTTAVDPILGQGMGLGLPITRSILEQYGAEIEFVKPRRGFATALQIVFPEP